eukprot:353624-Chlamydomonas_euryale.AAC.8
MAQQGAQTMQRAMQPTMQASMQPTVQPAMQPPCRLPCTRCMVILGKCGQQICNSSCTAAVVKLIYPVHAVSNLRQILRQILYLTSFFLKVCTPQHTR